MIDSPGRYYLKWGLVHTILPPPERPALLEASSITGSSISLVWNGPVVRQSDIKGFQLFRDGALLVSLGEQERVEVTMGLDGV